jgi:hypothetical protein
VYPNDGGPRHAIEIGRLYAEGNASEEALWAARDAARVARAAAWDAAWKGEAAEPEGLVLKRLPGGPYAGGRCMDWIKVKKAANRTGRIVWCKAFGYNAYHSPTV